MKKKIATILVVVIIMTCIPISSSAASNITVTYNGQPIYFDVQPQMVNNRVMVPMRAIFERFGMYVTWKPETREIYATNGPKTIEMGIGSYWISKDKVPFYIDVPPMILNNRTLVPLRAVSEALDMDVNWDGLTRSVTITNKAVDPYEVLKNTIIEHGKLELNEFSSKVEYNLDSKTTGNGYIETSRLTYDPSSGRISISQTTDTIGDNFAVGGGVNLSNAGWNGMRFVVYTGYESIIGQDEMTGFVNQNTFNGNGMTGLSQIEYNIKNRGVTRETMNEIAVSTVAVLLIDLEIMLEKYNTGLSIRDFGFTAFADKHGIY